MYMSLFLDPPREIFIIYCCIKGYNTIHYLSHFLIIQSVCCITGQVVLFITIKSGVSNHYGGNIVLPIIQVVREINTGNKPWGIHRINR